MRTLGSGDQTQFDQQSDKFLSLRCIWRLGLSPEASAFYSGVHVNFLQETRVANEATGMNYFPFSSAAPKKLTSCGKTAISLVVTS